MKLPELLRIEDHLDVVDDGGDVLERSTLEHKSKHKSARSDCLSMHIFKVSWAIFHTAGRSVWISNTHFEGTIQ